MPPTSRYGPHPNRPAANKQFINRDAPINAFQAARQALVSEQHYVLAFYGVGGQGKTALGRKFRQILEEETPRAALWGHVDLADTHLPTLDRILLELRCSLRRSGIIEFPAFDVAFAHYWQQAYPHLKFQDTHRDLFTDKEGVFAHALESASSYAEALPAGIGLTMKALNGVRQRMRDFDNRYLPALRGLETFSPTEILDRLPYYLGLDLCSYQRRQRAKQLIVFLDTYEALWETFTQGARWEVDAWARELVASVPGVLFVVFAREKLTWDTHEPDAWRGCLHHQPRLTLLTDEDADTFLRQIPIEEEAVRQTIIQAAEGHPFYLDLEVEHYLDLVADGATPQPEHFGQTKQAILAGFLRYRAGEEQATLKVLSVVRSFDFELLEALVRAFQTGFPLTEFSHFVRYSFVEPESGGRYRLHGLMQAHLLESVEPALQKKIHDFAFTYYDARCQPKSPKDLQPAHEIALVEAFYHQDMTDPQEAVAWINQRTTVFYEAARYSLVEPLYQRALAICEQVLGPDHPHTHRVRQNYQALLAAMGQQK
ncbi:tetratricopeptide repeat protein [Nitrosococcus oceani]|uniref:tetratricopeptide repeat protein n=1 Tax=Nitrosococcus oceani TaxID=1229 RepID=UPI001E5BF14F|nr:tetratricopeptide repeat protein [Nitrosococcus oceani]